MLGSGAGIRASSALPPSKAAPLPKMVRANSRGRRAKDNSGVASPFWGSVNPTSLVRLPSLPPYLSSLPGAEQRLRALRVLAASGLVLLLRPFWLLSWLPGWVVGALLFWTIGELVLWLWWPRRWR